MPRSVGSPARSLRWIAWFDLAVTGLFALPFIAWPALSLLMEAEASLFGPARVHALPAAPWSLFVNLMGMLGVLWATARLIVEDRRLWLLDAGGRIVVGLAIIYGLWALGLPWLFAGFVLTEFGGALWTFVACRQNPLASNS